MEKSVLHYAATKFSGVELNSPTTRYR